MTADTVSLRPIWRFFAVAPRSTTVARSNVKPVIIGCAMVPKKPRERPPLCYAAGHLWVMFPMHRTPYLHRTSAHAGTIRAYALTGFASVHAGRRVAGLAPSQRPVR